MRTLLTPRWIAGHVLAIAAVVAFVSFGFWQLDRHDQKRQIAADVEAAAGLPRVVLDAVEGALAYRVVWAEGEYDPAAEVLALRSRSGTSGYGVVTPLVMEDGTAVLVLRGWVPLDYDEVPVAEAAPPEGTVRVTGQMWPAGEGGVPAERPEIVKQIDPAVVDAFTPYPILEGHYLLAFEQTPPITGGVMVYPDRPEVSLGPHLGYAGQWFLFAAVVVVGYPILLRRRATRPS